MQGMAQSYINDHTTEYSSLKSRLMGGGLSRQRADHFDVLNRHLRHGLVTPGQLVIIPDAYSEQCSRDEAWLMRRAEQVRRDLERRDGWRVAWRGLRPGEPMARRLGGVFVG